MTVNKTKKNIRQRGSKTHGWGSMKKHRGAGNRGGRGNAGSGKRGDAKKPSYQKIKNMDNVGFTPKGAKKVIRAINLSYIDNNLNNLVEKKLVEKKGDVYEVDLAKLGFDKILATGKVTRKIKLTAKLYSKNVEEKIKKAGGEVVVSAKAVAPKPDAKAKAAKPAEATKE